MLSKLKSIKDSENLPHVLGMLAGVVAAIIFGGMVTNEADQLQVIIDETEANSGPDPELSE